MPFNLVTTHISVSKMGMKFVLCLYTMCFLHSVSYSNMNCMASTLHSRELYNFAPVIDNNINPNKNIYEHHSDGRQIVSQSDIQSHPRARQNDKFAEGPVIQGRSYVITLYHWNNHLGRPVQLEWTNAEEDRLACKELPVKSRGKVRSVNTHNNCVVIFSRDSCRGPSRILKVGSPSHNRLSDLCFHKRPQSARPCTEKEKSL